MAQVISLMVLPTGSAEVLPQILMERSGLWRDMSPSLDIRLSVRSQALRENMDTLLGELMAQMEHNAHPSLAILKAAFKGHYRVIVPAGVQQALADALSQSAPGTPPLLKLHIHPAAEWIPWELLHDGKDFLGLNFQIARLPILPNSPDLSFYEPHRVDQVCSLLAKNAFDEPLAPQLEQAWQETFSGLLPPGVQLTRYPGESAPAPGYPNVEDLIRAGSSSDILHITCHGHLEDRFDRYFWSLDHLSPLIYDYKINAALVSDLPLAQNPLVFGNACGSPTAAAADSSGMLSPGFGSLFFAQGAVGFIGTFAPITQALAAPFARKFYEYLLAERLPLGRALLAAKRYFAENGEADPSFLYYCLYGPAETSFYAAPEGG